MQKYIVVIEFTDNGDRELIETPLLKNTKEAWAWGKDLVDDSNGKYAIEGCAPLKLLGIGNI